jgi:hypothetical protein
MLLAAKSLPDLPIWELLLRMGLAAVLGGAIGVERELREREAGLRTHMLVAMGSALFTIVSAYGFREVLNGDLEPKWTEVWAHINLGKIYDITDQRERAVNEYKLAQRTKDNTQGALEEAQKYITAKFERPRNTNN